METGHGFRNGAAPRCCGRLRVYDLPPDVLEQPALAAKAHSSSSGGWAEAPDNLPVVLYVDEGETIYDYAWYPGMLASEPATSVFAATSRVRHFRFSKSPFCSWP